jgi:predicted transcriptional regulator
MMEDQKSLEQLADYFAVLSNLTRLRILKYIKTKPKDIRSISNEIRTSHENTKKHMDKLLKMGVVIRNIGVGKQTSKGTRPVWKYSIISGRFDQIINDMTEIILLANNGNYNDRC